MPKTQPGPGLLTDFLLTETERLPLYQGLWRIEYLFVRLLGIPNTKPPTKFEVSSSSSLRDIAL